MAGSEGILPASEYLERVHGNLGGDAYWRLPTLFWVSASDAALGSLAIVGIVLSLLLIAGVAPLVSLVLLWAGYLSLVNVGGAFLSFQWDVLLLETAVVSMFLAPLDWRPRGPGVAPEPSRAGLWLARLLLFKLMVLSGAVKLISLDETWWQLTALDVHYYTQPLPAWTSWYAHHLPETFQKLCVWLMFVIEIGVPFLIFGPRVLCRVAAAALVFLQLLIGFTGNYNFFNLLTIVLCVPLLDDACLLALVPARWRTGLAGRTVDPPVRRSRARRAVVTSLAATLLFLSFLVSVRELVRTRPAEGIDGLAGELFDLADEKIVSWAQPKVLRYTGAFHSVNGYGLFRRMTTRRPEIVLEGSDDGETWTEITFRWKPGDPAGRPRFVQPHQPRLDWQMWFAALNPRGANHWLQSLAFHVLSGTPDVLELLGPSPFADRPPAELRFVYYSYEFTTPDERRASGSWWRRERLGASRTVTLADFTSRSP